MSKNKENWEKFFNTIFKRKDLKVEAVTDNNICLRISDSANLEVITVLSHI